MKPIVMCYRLGMFLWWIPQVYWETFVNLRTRPLELLGAGWAVIWGMWVGNPGSVIFTSSATFRVMGLVAPEWLWGLVTVIVGLGQLGAIYNESLVWRYRIGVTAFLLWGFVTLLFILSNLNSTAPVTYGMMFLISLMVAGKLRWRLAVGESGAE